MNIKFDERGGIISCGNPSQIPAAENVIEVDDKVLPQDFLRTFALGKYIVDPKKKKLVENKKFKMPERPQSPDELMLLLPGKTQKTLSGKASKPKNSSSISKRKQGSK